MLAEGRPKRMNRTAAFVDVATGAVDPSSWTEPEECPVSLKQLSLESPMLYIIPRAGTCGHLFHDDGLVGEHTQGLLRLKRCPLCRAEINLGAGGALAHGKQDARGLHAQRDGLAGGHI